MGTIQTLFEEAGYSQGHGYQDTAIPEVKLFRADRHEATCPLLYNRGLAFVLQGYKVGEAAGQQICTNSQNYLILCNTRAINCETVATSEEPVLGLHIDINVLEVQRLLQILHENPTAAIRPERAANHSLVSAPISAPVRKSLDELIDVLHDQGESQALGPSCLTRLYFSVLRSEAGGVLESLVSADSKLSRISNAIRFMDAHLHQKVAMEDLASIASMSLSAFHRSFREVTGDTPLQYLKELRLNRARNMIAFGGKPANAAARSVGYESANQFSREFKRYFGVPPSRAKELPYSTLQGVATNGH